MAQLMPLPLTVSCFSKIQIGFTFLVLAHPGSPGQRAVKRACMRACVRVSVSVCLCVSVLGTSMSCTRRSEQMKMSFGMWTRGAKEPDVRLGPDPPQEGALLHFVQVNILNFIHRGAAAMCFRLPLIVAACSGCDCQVLISCVITTATSSWLTLVLQSVCTQLSLGRLHTP